MRYPFLLLLRSVFPSHHIFRALILFCFLTAALCVHAQPLDTTGRWKAVGPGLETGFGAANLDLSTVDFVDPRIGFAGTSIVNNSVLYFHTSDGGGTWAQSVTGPTGSVPLKFRHGIVYNRYGQFSRDSGATWDLLKPALPGISSSTIAIADVEFLSSTRILALYNQVPELPDTVIVKVSFGGEPIYWRVARSPRPRQLALSTDGGGTWQGLDTLILRDTVLSLTEPHSELRPRAPFGTFPTPEGGDTTTYSWVGSVQSRYAADVRLMLSAVQNGGTGGAGDHRYLCTIDTGLTSFAWHQMSLPVNNVEFVTESTAYGYVVANSIARFYRSEDSGSTWKEFSVPISGGAASSVRFLTPNTAVAPGLISRDGWKTWSRWDSPFLKRLESNSTAPAFFPLDTANFFVVGSNSLFAHSSDQGKTWQHNQAGGVSDAIAAFDGHLLVGRVHQSLLLSTDAGVTWRDAGLEGGVPDGLDRFRALAFVDTAAGADEVVGIAEFVDYDTSSYVAMVQSTDGGMHWNVGAHLSDISFLSNNVPPPMMWFLPNDGGAGVTGFLLYDSALYLSNDRGSSWNRANTGFPVSAVAMSDSRHGVASAFVAHPGITGAMYATTDGGTTWSRTQDLTEYTREIGHYIHAFDGDHYMAIMRDYNTPTDWSYTASTDGGQSWSVPVDGGVDGLAPVDIVGWMSPTQALSVDDGGDIYYSESGGKDFTSVHVDKNYIGDGPSVAVGDGRYLYIAGTNGTVARWDLSAASSGVEYFHQQALDASVIGNPVTNGRVALHWLSGRSGEVQIDLFDPSGRSVLRRSEVVDAGIVDLSIDLSAFSAGRYTIRLVTAGGEAVLPVVLLK